MDKVKTTVGTLYVDGVKVGEVKDLNVSIRKNPWIEEAAEVTIRQLQEADVQDCIIKLGSPVEMHTADYVEEGKERTHVAILGMGCKGTLTLVQSPQLAEFIEQIMKPVREMEEQLAKLSALGLNDEAITGIRHAVSKGLIDNAAIDRFIEKLRAWNESADLAGSFMRLADAFGQGAEKELPTAEYLGQPRNRKERRQGIDILEKKPWKKDRHYE